MAYILVLVLASGLKKLADELTGIFEDTGGLVWG